MRMENITDLGFTDLHAEKARNKLLFVSWSKKPGTNQMARMAFLLVRKAIHLIGKYCAF